MNDRERLAGEDPTAAARQAAALFALAGLLAFAGIPNSPGPPDTLIAIGAGDLLLAAVAWLAPWRRASPDAPVLLALPAFVVLGYSTWAFGGFAAGTGPFFVLVFAWLGLNFPPRALLAFILPATAAYLVPLLLTDQSPQIVASAVVLLPIAVAIGLLIAHQQQRQRHDRARLAAAERWRAALTATLAHDLRSPLTTIQLVLDALADGLPETQRQHMLESAGRQVARLNRLAATLLDVERVDTQGRLRLDLSDVDVGAAVRASVGYLNAPDVVVDVPAGLRIAADPERLEQMLVNLVGNARRHGAPPVEVRARTGPGEVRIEVRDHGPGVPPELIGQLFSRFSAADDAPQSVGLGLWIVRQLARAHGGDVCYEPAEPGARLVLTLPTSPGGPA